MKYIVDEDKILLSINKGENINSSILEAAKENNLIFGWVNGIGAIFDPEIGYWDIQNKKYVKKIMKV